MSPVRRSSVAVAVAVLVLALSRPADGQCESSRLRQGCRIQEGGCLCGNGCDTDYRYVDKQECEAALRGRSRDPCHPNPCANHGACLQVFNSAVGFNCLCTGTDFYGDRCEKRCPRPKSLAPGQTLPVQCIVI